MARIVLIHGIGQQASTAALQTRMWLPSIVKGVLLSGHGAASDVAAQIAASIDDPAVAGIEMAFYGDLFLAKGIQGEADGASPEILSMADSLAAALLSAAADQRDQRLRTEALVALNQAEPDQADTQAVGALARGAMAQLDRNAWLTARIFGLAQRARPNLVQVVRYLTDDVLRDEVQSRATSLVGDDTRIVISHSLGSVVGWEACQILQRTIPTFITLGSPLGLDTVIYPRLRPSPPTFPSAVKRWINVAHPDDVIAVEQRLAALFPSLDSREVEDLNPLSRSEHHSAVTYLEEPVVGLAVVEALAVGGA